MIGDTYVILWKAEELGELNASYQVDEDAPGLLLIGSDGGVMPSRMTHARYPGPLSGFHLSAWTCKPLRSLVHHSPAFSRFSARGREFDCP